MNLFFLLAEAARRFPDRGAVYSGIERVRTYAQLRGRALCLAGALRRQWGPAVRIALVSENRPEYVELLFGIWAAGLVAVPINAKLHAREMVQILEDTQAAAAFVSPKLVSELKTALKGSAAAGCRLLEVGSSEYAAFESAEPVAPHQALPETLGWLFFTSGTTGRSKGAMLSHRNLLSMTLAHLADVESPDENSSLIHAAPMSHGSGLYILPYLARGARHVVPASSSFDPSEFLDLCDRHPSCSAFLAPTMVRRLRVQAQDGGRAGGNLRTVVYGGGPMYVEDLRKSIAVFGQIFTQIYGQGESPMTITSLRRADHSSQDDKVLGSVGCARTGIELAVVAPDGTPLPQGDIGEVVCRGDVVMSGYWNNPQASAEALRSGWLYTGDMGSLDERGYLTLRDRSKDLIISGGSNIYPREVEEALLTHPGVGEVCVIGQPDPEWGETVVAFVVRAPGPCVDDASLDAHCVARIARFKRPKRYIYVDALPKNSYGKVLKRELRGLLQSSEVSS